VGINWETNGKNGWIIQKITNKFNITDCKGKKLANYNDPLLKTYWEAWQVINGVVQGDPRGDDLWAQGENGQGSSGHTNTIRLKRCMVNE